MDMYQQPDFEDQSRLQQALGHMPLLDQQIVGAYSGVSNFTDGGTYPCIPEPHEQNRGFPKLFLDSHQDSDGVIERDFIAEERKAQSLREKNKLAAIRCRHKKKKEAEGIEAKCNDLSMVNAALKKQLHDLRNGLASLRAHALDHQSCNCGVVLYNTNLANRLAPGGTSPLAAIDVGVHSS
ncbi:hypothetical protein WHR41_09370 [Cladosporium halotolerans]|uniref:BZIP domain-containing protein n=1 Tax=Cladosporium halotolerans TaxID=1052096 RepID=A0AB34KE23_9PEZI